MTIYLRPAGWAERCLRVGTGLATLCLLAACGGGGGDGVTRGPTPVTPSDTTYNIPDGEQALRLFADSVPGGDAGGAIANDQTLTARSVGSAAVALDYGDDVTAPTGTTQVQLRRNADGELTLIVNGAAYDFEPGDRENAFGYFTADECDTSDVCVSTFNYTGEIDELLTNGFGYAEVVGYQTNQLTDDGGENLRGFAVVGAETRDSALAGLPTATYSGRAEIGTFPSTGFIDNETSRQGIRGDLSMTADFGAGTISGQVTNLQSETGFSGYNPAAGSITMEQAEFDVNGFRGGMSASADYAAGSEDLVNNSSYSGAFYGPAAEEVGGTISGSGAGRNGAGYFYGNKD